MTTLFLIFALTICASFIQRVTGFGFGIFVMMFFPYFLPSYGVSTTLSGLLAGSSALVILLQGWRHIRWRLIAPLLIINILVACVAIEYMATLADYTVKRCFGAMFILVALYFLLHDGTQKLPDNRLTMAGLSSLSGVMGGMFAMPGPPLVLYCVNRIDDKRAYISTLQALSLILNIFYTAFRVRAGFFDADTPLWYISGIGGVVIGTCIGNIAFKHTSPALLKKIVYTMLLISGIAAVV